MNNNLKRNIIIFISEIKKNKTENRYLIRLQNQNEIIMK